MPLLVYVGGDNVMWNVGAPGAERGSWLTTSKEMGGGCLSPTTRRNHSTNMLNGLGSRLSQRLQVRGWTDKRGHLAGLTGPRSELPWILTHGTVSNIFELFLSHCLNGSEVENGCNPEQPFSSCLPGCFSLGSGSPFC